MIPTTRLQRIALALDLVLVVVFATIGRANHDEGLSLTGIAHTAWPFVVGVVVGALLITGAKRAPMSRDAGVLSWACALVLGMVLRHLSGQGTAVAFVIVAAIVLAVFLVGWRLLVALVVRRKLIG
jgi:peptidoglycan/LPS O-acetylase OafA/YrhL